MHCELKFITFGVNLTASKLHVRLVLPVLGFAMLRRDELSTLQNAVSHNLQTIQMVLNASISIWMFKDQEIVPMRITRCVLELCAINAPKGFSL